MPEIVKQFPIEKEYEKNKSITADDINKLREWLMTQKHLPGEHLSDLDLAIVFHCCDNSSEVSKQVLDLHYTLRTLFTTFFKDRIVDLKLEGALYNVLIAPLPTPTVQGYRAMYLRLLDPDSRNFNFPVTAKAMMMVFDLWQYQEGTWPGFILMIDMDQSTLGHVAKLDLMSLKQVLYFLQEAMLIRLKGVHFLNAPYFMDKVMMLIKPFIKKALMDIIHIHQPKSEELYDFVPKKAFPKEEGGEHKDHNTMRDETIDLLKTNTQFFKEESLRRVNEALRAGGKKTVEDLFGIQGSFKKLDID
ncbi:PREDICTED: clavesin-1-like [Papilio polytes]|uniref:clavesin-1-like n=1 Tax=Papilio polytes TaxID=76194 RepID=UPI0006766C6C|nr:PREDICTED: clavesin-1-like [Papilio polytes]